ncbi:MAG: AAA family ATPase, partial [bacterium]|nr:AAA family ATPase [bacterium]
MDIVQNILFQNNQWKEDKFQTFEFKRDLFDKVWKDLDTKLISLITGPRRMGKSVILKQLANELITKSKINPKQILFYEFFPNDKNETIWDVFEYFTKEICDPRLPIYLFFDEIQYVLAYESMIKN